jgi:hypothetical protein
MLNRQNELRDQGFTWDEINEVISEEFDLEFPLGMAGDLKHIRHGGHPGFGCNKQDY